MSDGDGGALGHQCVQGIPDQQFGLCVDARRGFVEDQDARVERQIIAVGPRIVLNCSEFP